LTESRNQNSPEAVVLTPVEMLMKEVHSRRVPSGVTSSFEIGHSGMQGATGSGVLRLTDNEDSNSSDGTLMAIKEGSVDKVTSYSEDTRLNASVEGNRSKQLKGT
jgi:hypothetical protein